MAVLSRVAAEVFVLVPVVSVDTGHLSCPAVSEPQ